MSSSRALPAPWTRPRFLLLLAVVLAVAAPVLALERPGAPTRRPATPSSTDRGAATEQFTARFAPGRIAVLSPHALQVSVLITNGTSTAGSEECTIEVVNPVHAGTAATLQASGAAFDTHLLKPGQSERIRRVFTGDIAVSVNSVAVGTTYPRAAPTGGSQVFCATSPLGGDAILNSWSERYPNVPRPTFTFLTHVSCSSLSRCMAIGDRYGVHRTGMVAERWDGSRWTVAFATHALRAQLVGVSCPTSGWCMLLGQRGGLDDRTFVRVWSDGAVTVHDPPGAAMLLNAVSCLSPTSCVAVGGDAHEPRLLAEHWNGATWSRMPTTSTTTDQQVPTSVSCTSASSCVAVGAGGYPQWNFAMRWDGHAWASLPVQQVPLPPDRTFPDGGPRAPPVPGLTTVSCGSATSCLAIGTLGLVERWDGSTWRIVEAAPSRVTGVACTSAARCLAVGVARHLARSRATAYLWDGSTWSDASPSARPLLALGAAFADVACPRPRACVAVGSVVRYPVAGANAFSLWGRWLAGSWRSLRR